QCHYSRRAKHFMHKGHKVSLPGLWLLRGVHLAFPPKAEPIFVGSLTDKALMARAGQPVFWRGVLILTDWSICMGVM
uniref:hypothetical protein n=1 Tax=Yoonia sp. TaxID=2212373 RepID=UPI004047598B